MALVLGLGLGMASFSPAAQAGRKDDHDRARAAVQAGEVLPLPALLERLQRTHPGRVLELELEREHGRWIYEVKLLQPDGQLLKLEVDAATATVLRVRRADEGRSGRERGHESGRGGDRDRDRDRSPDRARERAAGASGPATGAALAPAPAPVSAPSSAPSSAASSTASPAKSSAPEGRR